MSGRPQPFLEPARAERLRARVAQLLEDHKLSVLARIGNTRLVELRRLAADYAPVRVFAKVESQNPTASVKDRAMFYLVADAIERGELKDGTTIVEASSGNAGVSLAAIGSAMGFKVLITAPDNVSIERFKLITAVGAELMLTPGAKGTTGAIELARELSNKPGFHWLAQHYNPVNSFAHFETTGPELVRQLREAGEEQIDAFVASSGTTGTLMGVSAWLREVRREAKVVAVWPRDKIMGIRRPEGPDAPGIYDASLIHDVLETTFADSMQRVFELGRKEGIIAGPSGGAAVLGALEVAKHLKNSRGRGTVVTLIPDAGERYLSLDAYGTLLPGRTG